MFESSYEVAFVVTTIILGWIGWGIFVLIVNKMQRRADIRHTEARSDILGSVNQHKHSFVFWGTTRNTYNFICTGDIPSAMSGRVYRCGSWCGIPKKDFWGISKNQNEI